MIKAQYGSKLSPAAPFNLDPRITYKTPEFVPTYNKTVPEVNVISAKLPGVEVTAPDLSKTLRFPYGGINVVSKSMNGGLDRKQRIFVNPFEGHDLVASKLEGGTVERADNTRVQKPIPSIVNKNSHIGSYDGVPVRVNNNYPYNDKYLLEAPTRSIYSPHENIKINAKYPHVYGVELTSLLPQYLQVIDNNDTTYYVQGKDENYYPAVGLSTRPIFRENFNKKGRKAESSYFRSPISFINKLK